MNVSNDDSQVIAKVLSGDSEAFGTIVARYNQRLFRVARAILKSQHEAEEALQQAYVSAFLNLKQFQGRSSLSTWLTRIVIRESCARAQKQGEFVGEDEVLNAEHVDLDPTPEEWAAGQELLASLETAIDCLAPSYRLVWMMREVQGMSVAETAECLNIAPEAVRVRQHRANLQLRSILAKTEDLRSAEAFLFLGESCRQLAGRVLSLIGGPNYGATIVPS